MTKIWKCAYCEYEMDESKVRQGKCDRCGRKNMQKPENYSEDKDANIPFQIFTDQYGRIFASVPIDNGGTANYLIRSRTFRGIAINQINGKDHKSPTTENINVFLGQCEAKACTDNLRFEIYNRAARFEDDYYIDIGDDAWRVVRVNKDGWKILDAQPFPMFMRYNHMLSLNIAESGTREHFSKYIELLHLSQNNAVLVEPYLVLTALPGIEHVILMFIGSQGSVKSTAQELIARVFDPTITETLTMPHQQRELVQQLMHHYIPVFDNVDVLSDSLASDLCRACTGGGFEARELYTNDDDVIYRYKRKVMLNSRDVPNHRPDFLERSMIIQQERVPKGERLEKRIVLETASKLLPYVRAYCLEVLVRAMNLYDSVSSELQGKLPRMADYCVWAESVARAMDYEPLVFYNAYMRMQDNQTLDALYSDTVGELLLKWLNANSEYCDHGEVSIPAGEFYEQLSNMVIQHGYSQKSIRFPGNATWMTHRINNLKHSLAEYGISFQVERTRDSNRYYFSNSSTGSTAPQLRQQGTSGAIKEGVELIDSDTSTKKTEDSGGNGASGAISGIIHNKVVIFFKQKGKADYKEFIDPLPDSEKEQACAVIEQMRQSGELSEVQPNVFCLMEIV